MLFPCHTQGMQITAKEIGRQLVITLGGATDDMDLEDAEIANRDVRRIVIPPVDAEVGVLIWSYYGRILFGTTDASAETTAHQMTRHAVGAYSDEDSTPEQVAAAEKQWAIIDSFRWGEGERICQLALYWNAQGGGADVVEAALRDGHPKAQELLMTRNQVWNTYSRLRMLTRSPDSESENETLAPTGSSGTSTPSGSSQRVARDAFGIKQPASDS